MRSWSVPALFIVSLALSVAACRSVHAQSAGSTVPVTSLKMTDGNMMKHVSNVSISTAQYPSAYVPNYGIEFALDKKYDWFLAQVGIDDTAPTGETRRLVISLDGQEVFSEEYKAFDAPKPVKIPVTGKMRMSLDNNYNSDLLSLINPCVIVGQPPQQVPATPTGVTGPPLSTGAPFAVDPNDLDKLATALRAAVDAKPQLKSKVDNGNVALMSFTLVDITAQSVATNVAEDLYTAMIKRDFPLVERGQLDKILKELKIQDTGLIDPTTAQKIGQLSGCNIIVVGSISDRGTFVVINSRLLDTATGKALTAERVEMRKVPISR